MITKFNHLLDKISEFFARRKGLLPAIGMVLVLINYILQFVPWFGWFSESDLLLHMGIVIAILGFLLAWAL